MFWKRQPYKGLLLFSLAFLVSGVWLSAMPKLGYDYYEIGMNWIFSWFYFGFAYQIFWEVWPFSKIKQPLGGLLGGVLAMAVSAIAWKILLISFEQTEAFALLSYSQFFLFTVGWFYHNWPVAGHIAPLRGSILTIAGLALVSRSLKSLV